MSHVLLCQLVTGVLLIIAEQGFFKQHFLLMNLALLFTRYNITQVGMVAGKSN